MRARHFIAALVCSSILSTGIGFAAAQLSQPEPASARAGSSQVVSQLKKLHSDLGTLGVTLGSVDAHISELDSHVGTSAFDFGSIFYDIHKIEHNTDEACQAVKGSSVC